MVHDSYLEAVRSPRFLGLYGSSKYAGPAAIPLAEEAATEALVAPVVAPILAEGAEGLATSMGSQAFTNAGALTAEEIANAGGSAAARAAAGTGARAAAGGAARSAAGRTWGSWAANGAKNLVGYTPGRSWGGWALNGVKNLASAAGQGLAWDAGEKAIGAGAKALGYGGEEAAGAAGVAGASRLSRPSYIDSAYDSKYRPHQSEFAPQSQPRAPRPVSHPSGGLGIGATYTNTAR